MRISILILFGALTLLTGETNPDFAQFGRVSQYEVPVYAGPRAVPDFSRSQRQYRFYRTSLREGFSHAPIAAGHYAVIMIGCGMQCVNYFFGNVRSGKIVSFPIGGEYYPSLVLVTRENNRLVLGRVDKRDSQTLLVLIQGCSLRSCHGPWGLVGCGMGSDWSAAAI